MIIITIKTVIIMIKNKGNSKEKKRETKRE